MADEDKDWQLDAMLDSLLRSYSAADPRPGYETRLRAVVKARMTRARRASWLMVAASGAAVVLLAWAMMENPHTAKTVDRPVAVKALSPPPLDATAPEIAEQGHAARPIDRPARFHKGVDNRIVLQLVDTTHGSGGLVFEREKLYLTPETSPEPAATTPAAEQGQAQAAVPVVSIQDFGIASIESNAPIEIKDLAPPKSSNEKGSL